MLSDIKHLEGRFPGLHRDVSDRHVKVVGRQVVHNKVMDFKDFCPHILREDTKYLVLDLDGTFHNGLNLGVLLGWELSAFQAYGMEYLESLGSKGRVGSFVFNWKDQAAQGRYAKYGAKRWLLPGLLYFSLARVGWKASPVRKSLRHSLGPHAMDKLLALMRLSLMHQMANTSLEDVYTLVRSLWKRHGAHQVIEPGDIHWLRQAYPDLKIIVSSASPRACLEIVREKFPVHDIFCTEIETREGRTSSPHWMHPLFGSKKPRRIAPPPSLRQNAYYNKIKNICRKYPDFMDANVHTVGITDTKHGEDYPWTEYFKCVVDINSPDPFSPLVSTASPLEEIHSAKISTRGEKAQVMAGKTPERHEISHADQSPKSVVFLEEELSTILEEEITRAETAARTCFEAAPEVMKNLKSLAGEVFTHEQALENSVIGYNGSHGQDRDRAFEKVRHNLKQTYRLNRNLNQHMNPISKPWSEIEKTMEHATRKVHKMAGRTPETQVEI